MQTAQEKKLRYKICCQKLPLAVYREVAAHLRQVEGVETGLIPQQSQQFDYSQSQVAGLWVQYSEDADPEVRQQVDRILAYYSDRFGVWERDDTLPDGREV
ncbi:hypothetical protein PN499_12655 [Kamptonema animale CS-326]|jgi:hypothetical protein|uniref:hypothetical protein n=1 Tax=Kamptonema animale TaxID=92934 RepID=UPI00232D5B7B|nr:hypothetical protein [Kamptonema animale]MDB9512037.1 hypothetical protein [Kamptonema animale CS-326]